MRVGTTAPFLWAAVLALDANTLLECFRERFGEDPLKDGLVRRSRGGSSESYLPEDLAEYYLSRVFPSESARSDTMWEYDGHLFVIPFAVLSYNTGECRKTTHDERQRRVYSELLSIPRHRWNQTYFLCQSFNCRNYVHRDIHDLIESTGRIRYLIHENNVNWIDWGRKGRLPQSLIVPYVAHSAIHRRSGVRPSETQPTIVFHGDLRGYSTSVRRVFARRSEVRPNVRFKETGTLRMTPTIVREYADTMLRSTFCFVPRGDTPTTRRLFDAILAGCVPVVVSDGIDTSLPFPHLIPYHRFWIRIEEVAWIERTDAILDAVLSIPRDDVERRVKIMGQHSDLLDWRHHPDRVLAAILNTPFLS